MSQQNPASASSDDDSPKGDPWHAFGYIVSGVGVYGVLGWLADPGRAWLGECVEELEARGLSTTVADARFAKPLDEELILRLAGSRVLARPSMADIRNFLNIGLEGSELTATAGNPFLRPATAWQFDASVEWYFAPVGSLTFNAFYKDVKDFSFTRVYNFNELDANGIPIPDPEGAARAWRARTARPPRSTGCEHRSCCTAPRPD